MDPEADLWLLSPSGSRAEDTWPEDDFAFPSYEVPSSSGQHDAFMAHGDGPDEDEAFVANVFGASDPGTYHRA